MAAKQTSKSGKQPFVQKEDRPELTLKSTATLGSLTVRELTTILGQFGTRKDFWDGKDWQKDDFDGGIKWKDTKEFKETKEFKDKDKESKEKREIKELKAEKIEVDGVFEPVEQVDPRMDQVIRALSGITAKVAQLADQIEALKKKG